MKAQSVSEIKANIHSWDIARSNSTGLNYLSQGFGFQISKEEYKNFAQINTEKLHCYIGLNQDNLALYIVDNKSDEDKNYTIGKNLIELQKVDYNQPIFSLKNSSIERGFLKKITTSANLLDPNVARERIVDWVVSGQQWYNSLESLRDSIPQVITISFSDVKDCANNDKILFLLALKEYRQEDKDNPYQKGYNLEIIVVGVKPEPVTSLQSDGLIISNTVYYDVTRPRPPFGQNETGFNLLT